VDVTGDTLTDTFVDDVGSSHWYVSGVDPVLVEASRTDDPPELIVEGVAVATAFGLLLTVTTTSSASVQPLPSVTVRLYVVVVAGVTATVAVVADEGSSHRYESGADPVLVEASRTDDPPEHIVDGVAVALAVGLLLTFTTIISTSVHP